MSDTALIVAPKAQITIGGRSLQEIPDADLVEKMFQEAADRLVLRAESVEIIGNDKMQAVAAAVLSDISKFIKERNDANDIEVKPFKDAVKKINNSLAILLAGVVEQKARIVGLTSKFAQRQQQIAEEERRKQRLESERIQREKAALEQEQLRLQEQKDAAAIAAMQPQSSFAVVYSSTAVTQPAPDPKAIAQKEQEIALKQAELNRQSAEASKVIEVPKVEGMAATTKWTFTIIGENDTEIRASMEKAFKAHPEWFDLKARTRVIENALKAADGKLECEGLTIFKDTKTRAT